MGSMCAQKNKKAGIGIRAFQKEDVDLALSFNRQCDVDRLFFLSQCPPQFRERNVLQLTDTFAGHAEFLADFLERLRFPAIEAEALENNFLLAIIEHVEQTAHFVA